MAGNGSDSDGIHNCVDSECNGADLSGSKFKCALCSQPMYVSCLTQRPEITTLLSLIAPTGEMNQNKQLVLKNSIE